MRQKREDIMVTKKAVNAITRLPCSLVSVSVAPDTGP